MIAIASLATLLLLGLPGCVYPVQRGAGPPPHAPAYGYRHHQANDGVDLVWDTHIGVYTVIGFPSVYFWDDNYYRYHKDFWQRGAGPRGRWKAYHGRVPPGLAKKHNGKKKKYKRGKGRYW